MEFIGRIKMLYPHMFEDVKVLEFGSLDINGSVRHMFNAKEYVGVDVGPGRGVDVVCEAQNYEAPSGSYDVTISAECFEHNPYWQDTFFNMIRLTRAGGLVIVTSAAWGRAEHGTTKTTPGDAPLIPWKDFYRNLAIYDLTSSVDLDSRFATWFCGENHPPHDLYFAGLINGALAGTRNLHHMSEFYCPTHYSLNKVLT
jgi:hypothetical protein